MSRGRGKYPLPAGSIIPLADLAAGAGSGAGCGEAWAEEGDPA
jgi:hypothetical protein